MHHYDQRSFPTKEVDEKLEECVDGESFIDISKGIEVESSCQRLDSSPGGSSVDRHHELNTDDISLKKGFSIVLAL